MVDMAHIAGLVATGLHPSPVPLADFVTSTTHKTLRGPRGGLILSTAQYAQAVDKSVFPGIQGGPFMHAIAAKAVAFGEALQPAFSSYQRQVIDNARVMGEELQRAGVAARRRRHRHASAARRPHAEEPHRQSGRGVSRRDPHHGQQERDPVRPAEARRHERHPARLAGDHVARLRRGRRARGRQDHRRGADRHRDGREERGACARASRS